MFFFNWNSPKKNAQADDAGNSNSFPSATSTQPANQPVSQPASQSANQFTTNQSSFQNYQPEPAFPQPTSAFGNKAADFSDYTKFGGPIDSDDTDTQVTPSPYTSPYAAPKNDSTVNASANFPIGDSPSSAITENDYVDAYVPPQHLRHTPWSDADDSSDPLMNTTQSAVPAAKPAYEPVAAPKVQAQDYFDQAAREQLAVTPPAKVSPQVNEKSKDESEDQTLEAQNIFHLLGVEDGGEDEKESFLDELQQVVWEDFVENDVALLLTESEYTEFKKIIDKKDVSNEDMQEEALVYLEKLVPDLEEILLEKAMELKKDMVMERVMGMKEFYANKPEFLQVITQVERLFAQDMWKDGADMLNTLK